MRKGQNRSIFQFAKHAVQEDRVITGNIPTELFFPLAPSVTRHKWEKERASGVFLSRQRGDYFFLRLLVLWWNSSWWKSYWIETLLAIFLWAVSFYSLLRSIQNPGQKTRKIAKLRFNSNSIQVSPFTVRVPGFVSFATVLQLCSQQENFGFV